MAGITPREPQSAADYNDRTSNAVKSVLVEIGQILASFQGKFAVVGGAVPWLLISAEDMTHVGTLDVDLSLDAEALGDGEYVSLVEALIDNGYNQRRDRKRFQLVREVPATDGGPAIDVVVDFLMARDAQIVKNTPAILSEFAVQRASGVDLALQFYNLVAIEGTMPGGGTNRVEIAVASIPALLAMKGFAIKGRHKQKDAYDIYFCVRNYSGGPSALADACRPLLSHDSAVKGFQAIAEKFAKPNGYGPTSVRKFVEDAGILGEQTADQWQVDAYEQVRAWLDAVGPLTITPAVGSRRDD